MLAISDKLSESEKVIYYQSLFTALNRSPVDMLLAKKSGDHDSDLSKILAIIQAQTVK